MCMAVVCPSCNKPTFRGCGAHVEQVLAHVPKDDRCKCRERASSASSPTTSDKPAR
ncbi:MAG: hypothetical protein JNK05_33395 [Myxococcales bacterium]|nr:hypothetical protein [Myxococcales bacterium]